MALVDVHLAARPRVALQTLAVKGTVRVHTLSRVLTRIAVGCNRQAPITGMEALDRVSHTWTVEAGRIVIARGLGVQESAS